MSIKSINESFDRLIEKEEIITEPQSSLEKTMLTIVDSMEHSGQTNLKAYEYALQDAIEKEYPGKAWWEVTSVNIFWDLFNNRDPKLTVQNIINDIEGNSIEEDYKESDSLKESPIYDMTPQHDGRKSFYGKAKVVDDNGELTLYSYNVPVAKISNGQVTLLDKWDWSQTTLRHVKEFLRQNGFEATTLSQMRNTYR